MKKGNFVGLACAALLFAVPAAVLAGDGSSSLQINSLEKEEEALMKQLRSLSVVKQESPKEPVEEAKAADEGAGGANIITAARVNSADSEILEREVPKAEPKAQKQVSAPTVNSVQLAKLREAKYRLQKKLNSTEERLHSLVGELRKSQEKLVMAEAEVARLSRIIEARNIRDLESLQPGNRAVEALEEKKYITPRQARVTQRERDTRSAHSPAVATVTARKANLRVGPGKQHSILFHVNEGSRLVVETRQGDWYRVIAPSGERAWISSSIVHFAPSGESRPSATVRAQGYQK